MRTVLIAGASGFIGGRLMEHLLRDGGCEIRAASRRLRDWPSGVRGYVVSAEDADALRTACDSADAVVSLASMGEAASSADPAAALRANVGGALSLSAAAINARVPRYVHVSTAKVYGTNLSGTVTEDSVCRPVTHYAITHRAAEDYARLHQGAVVLRLANGFGPPATARCGWDVIVNAMCLEAVTARRITLKSSGAAWRNFIPMGDVVRAIAAAINGLPADTYNLGSSESMSLRDAASRVARVCGRTLGFEPEVFTGAASGSESVQPLDFRVDRLARGGFAPSQSFDEEVSRTLLAARDRTPASAGAPAAAEFSGGTRP